MEHVAGKSDFRNQFAIIRKLSLRNMSREKIETQNYQFLPQAFINVPAEN